MITDSETNFVYVSDLLERRCPDAFQQLTHWFDRLQIRHGVLPATLDLWVVDFMPLQVAEDSFVQYRYDPDYLKPKKWRPYRSDALVVCNWIGITPSTVGIVLDGGNVVKSKKKVILTTKVFSENPDYGEQNLIAAIKSQLQVEQVILIPQEPKDFVGHADGMVRFINEETVLVNQYPKSKVYGDFGYHLRSSLRNAGLHCLDLPYTAWQNEDPNDASGCYINFLEVDHYIFYPVFGTSGDQGALLQLQTVFTDRELIAIDCKALAKLGGVLNCATWNIVKR